MSNILIEKSTNRVICITDNEIKLTDTEATVDNTIYSMFNSSNASVVNNVEPPTKDGNRYTYDGSSFTDTWPFKSVSRIDFIEMLETHAGFTDDLLVQSRDDQSLSSFWTKFEFADGLKRDHPYVVKGLDALVSTGYINDRGKKAVLDNWPRGR